MERLDTMPPSIMSERSNPHVHFGNHAKKCCDHKYGDCCHMSGIAHPWNVEIKPKEMEPLITRDEITIPDKAPTMAHEISDMDKLDDLEQTLRARLLVVSEVRNKIRKNLAENQVLLDSLGGLL